MKPLPLFLLFAVLFACNKPPKDSPTNRNRVELAYREHLNNLSRILKNNKMDIKNISIYLRAFKQEKILEIWTKDNSGNSFKKILQYDFCATSGTLGPKRKEGDRQIPEGFYKINRFNPKSKFHLSLGIDYPNRSDIKLGDKKYPGSDIFIHGGCQTVGCIPITDEKIKQLYVLALEAKKNGQTDIPVHIFPFKMSKVNLEKYSETYPTNIYFWASLKPIYDFFENNKMLPKIVVLKNGDYETLND